MENAPSRQRVVAVVLPRELSTTAVTMVPLVLAVMRTMPRKVESMEVS